MHIKDKGNNCDDNMERVVSDIVLRWEDLDEKVIKRYEEVQKIKTPSQLLLTQLDDMKPWLHECEKRMNNLPILTETHKDIIQRKQEIQVNIFL